MLSLLVLNRLIRARKCLPMNNIKFMRFISTSGKKREASSVINPEGKTESECLPEQKNWVSYGFEERDETADLNEMHSTYFFAVSLVLVGGAFVYAYRPMNEKDWVHREAYLELRRREKLGLPAVDPDFIPIGKVVLPTEEELEDIEIII